MQVKVDDIREIAVVGGGVMGAGVAMTFARYGYKVTILDIAASALERAKAIINEGRFGWHRAIEQERFTSEQIETFRGLISFTLLPAAIANADLVFEAVPEDEELKKQVFAELDAIAKPAAIFASNTSGFSISSLVQAVNRRDRIIGMHWFSPANVMRLVEVVYLPETSEDVIAAVEELCRKIGKTPIRVKDTPGTYGFVANRIYYAAIAEAQRIVEAGIATAEEVDTAMKLGYNWPAGPFEMLQGRDRGWED